jgi:hypothetical protein
MLLASVTEEFGYLDEAAPAEFLDARVEELDAVAESGDAM